MLFNCIMLIFKSFIILWIVQQPLGTACGKYDTSKDRSADKVKNRLAVIKIKV